MDTSQFLAEFGTIAAAPNGVQRLREMILQLAVMGKLVPQDPDDEPASVLLQRIAAEKDRLIRDGTIKRPKPLPAIHDGEKPFELPSGWKWENLGNLISVMDSGWSPACLDFPSRTKETWGVLKTTSVQNMAFHEIENKELPERLEPRSQYEVKAGDILITRAGPKNRVGISCLVETVRPKLMISDKIIRFHLITSSLYEPYIVLCLNSGATADYLEKAKSGMAESQVNISQDKLRLSPVPLCSFEEQKRIVAKVDSLMALCDKLETLQQQRQQLDPMTQTAVLDALLPSPLAGEGLGMGGSLAWQRLNQHMTTLFHTPESVKALRETILQLAVMGKLVPQDPNDEPAAVLLQHIAAEKDRLIQEGKIKRQKPLPAIRDDEKPFELPSGWEWTRWDNVALKIGDIDHKMPEEVKDGYPYVSPRDFYPNNTINFQNAKKISEVDFLALSAKIQPKIGDIIYPRYGTIGENRLVETDIDFLASYSCAVIKTMKDHIDPQYQFLFSVSNFTRDQAKKAENKTTQANVGIKSIQHFVMPLPPLAEQQRIVAKVDSLMALCDKLETRLQAARETAGLFAAEAVATM